MEEKFFSSLESVLFHDEHLPQVLEKLWTITLTLKKQVSLFTSQKDRSRESDGFRELGPPTSSSGNSEPSALPLQWRHLITLAALQRSSLVLARHRLVPFFIFSPLFLPLLIWSVLLCPSDVGSREWGKHLPRRKHTHALVNLHNTLTELLVECWIVRDQLVLHEANFWIETFHKLKVRHALITPFRVKLDIFV